MPPLLRSLPITPPQLSSADLLSLTPIVGDGAPSGVKSLLRCIHTAETPVEMASAPSRPRRPPLHVRDEEVSPDQGADSAAVDPRLDGDLRGADPSVVWNGLEDLLNLILPAQMWAA